MTSDHLYTPDPILNMARYAAVLGYITTLGDRYSPKILSVDGDIKKLKPKESVVDVYDGKITADSVSRYMYNSRGKTTEETVNVSNIFSKILSLDWESGIDFNDLSMMYTHSENKKKKLMILCRYALEGSSGNSVLDIISDLNKEKLEVTIIVVHIKRTKSNNKIYVFRPELKQNIKLEVMNIEEFYCVSTFHARSPSFQVIDEKDLPKGKSIAMVFEDDPHTRYINVEPGSVIMYVSEIPGSKNKYIFVKRVVERQKISDVIEKGARDK